MSDILLFTNNALESLNSTLNRLIGKGHLGVGKFGEIICAIIQYYGAKKISKERKIHLSQQETKISTLMLYYASTSNSTNILKGNFFFHFKEVLFSKIIKEHNLKH